MNLYSGITVQIIVNFVGLKKKNNNLLFDGNWSYYLKSIEVIGNIFNNPELLGSEE